MARAKQDDQSAGEADETASGSASPFDSTLQKVVLRALNKLSFEVFVFLIGYVALLVVVSIAAPNLSKDMWLLFYIVPVIGVGAYLWARRSPIAARVSGTKVRSLYASRAVVIGKGAGPGGGAVTVNSGIAQNGAVVAGELPMVAQGELEPELLKLFHSLSVENKMWLVTQARNRARSKPARNVE